MLLTIARSEKTHYTASQELMNLLLENGFTDCTTELGYHPHHQPSFYIETQSYRFRKNGSCIISFLRDWSIHLINGPVSRWERFDSISGPHLDFILSFCNLNTPDQEQFRENRGFIRDYDKIILELKNEKRD